MQRNSSSEKRLDKSLQPADIELFELDPVHGLPLGVRAKSSETKLEDWVKQQSDYVESCLTDKGAVLFRGFQVSTAEDLEGIVTSLTPELVNYIEGSSPRMRITNKVYTSTEYPPEFDISLHNELSYAHRWPGKLFFLCLHEPQSGGETPIADSRKIFQLLDKAVLEKFLQLGVKYVRNLHGGRGVGLSWQTVFETEDKAEVERYCQEGKIEFAWTRRGGLRTSQIRPAAVKYPKTGEMLWFNQVDQWHPSNLPAASRQAMHSLMKEADLPINAYYGDGSPLEAEVLTEIRRAVGQATVKNPWRAGDVLLVDNMLVAHGRSSYVGPRKIVLAMGGSIALQNVEAVTA